MPCSSQVQSLSQCPPAAARVTHVNSAGADVQDAVALVEALKHCLRLQILGHIGNLTDCLVPPGRHPHNHGVVDLRSRRLTRFDDVPSPSAHPRQRIAAASAWATRLAGVPAWLRRRLSESSTPTLARAAPEKGTWLRSSRQVLRFAIARGRVFFGLRLESSSWFINKRIAAFFKSLCLSVRVSSLFVCVLHGLEHGRTLAIILQQLVCGSQAAHLPMTTKASRGNGSQTNMLCGQSDRGHACEQVCLRRHWLESPNDLAAMF